jgi:hypothetical protein
MKTEETLCSGSHGVRVLCSNPPGSGLECVGVRSSLFVILLNEA